MSLLLGTVKGFISLEIWWKSKNYVLECGCLICFEFPFPSWFLHSCLDWDLSACMMVRRKHGGLQNAPQLQNMLDPLSRHGVTWTTRVPDFAFLQDEFAVSFAKAHVVSSIWARLLAVAKSGLVLKRSISHPVRYGASKRRARWDLLSRLFARLLKPWLMGPGLLERTTPFRWPQRTLTIDDCSIYICRWQHTSATLSYTEPPMLVRKMLGMNDDERLNLDDVGWF